MGTQIGGVVDTNSRREPFIFQPESLKTLSTRDQILFQQFGAGAAVELPVERIHFGFEKMAKENPGKIAVEHQGKVISFGKLNSKANQLAHILKNLDVNEQDNVGLYLERSIEMVIGILGALKAGAAYIPQDARITPTKQLLHITNVTNAKVILTLSHLRHRIPEAKGVRVLEIDTLMEKPANIVPMQQTPVKFSNTAFILFTSGTTGNPNGVKVTHKNLVNILMTRPGNLGMGPGKRVSQILNISFDMCAWETLGSLCNGATLVIRGKSIQEVAEQVDVIIATPSILGSIDADKCKNVEVVAVAGEPCPVELANRWSQFCAFHNSCGPTETTIINTLHSYSPVKGQLNIGGPTPNNTVYVLDENLQPCPIGEVGEMWAGGFCVTDGYIGNDKLTGERYKPDPFLGEGHMMFRTRDLGRWTRNGELQHLGRTDDQVKIKGFRVELDSVSTALESVLGCSQAVTLKLDDKTLVSFVRPANVNLGACANAVNALLPYYCAPKLILPLDEFPKTSRGKIEKRELTKLAVQELDKLEGGDNE